MYLYAHTNIFWSTLWCDRNGECIDPSIGKPFMCTSTLVQSFRCVSRRVPKGLLLRKNIIREDGQMHQPIQCGSACPTHTCAGGSGANMAPLLKDFTSRTNYVQRIGLRPVCVPGAALSLCSLFQERYTTTFMATAATATTAQPHSHTLNSTEC